MSSACEPPLLLDIDIALKREDGHSSATGKAKQEAFAAIDKILDEQLSEARPWPLADGIVVVAPLPMTKREYSMDAWSVRVRVHYTCANLPAVIQKMATARVEQEEAHFILRWGNRFLVALFGEKARKVIAQTKLQRIQEQARAYARAVATLAFARAGHTAEAFINQTPSSLPKQQ